jgi:integrase/recombinase XerD
MLTLYRRHLKSCPYRNAGRKYRRCRCPIWVDGFVGSRDMRKSLGIRDWLRAQGAARALEVGEPEPTSDLSPTLRSWSPQRPKGVPNVAQICEAFLADALARGLRESTIYKFRLLLKRLEEFACSNSFQLLSEITIDDLRRFRASWPNRNFAARKKWEALCVFYRFAHDSGWIDTNVCSKLKAPKTVDRPTMPLTTDEVTAILVACDAYPDPSNSIRLRALVLLLRYSGLRIRDAVTLARDQLRKDKLFLYTAKTGTPVYCPLPPIAVSALNAISSNAKYFFWTGRSKPKSVVGNWQRSLRKLFFLAGVPTAHAHRFRDTFSVELLQAGVPIERVSRLLGHQSVRVTEKHYNAWTRSRQEQAEADVRRTWNETVVTPKGTCGVREESRFVN